MTKKKVDELFFQLFCEKNSDGTRHLRLRGRELFQRFNFRLNEQHMQELGNFLCKNPTIISLDLSYNDVGDEGLKILIENFFNEPNNLKYLNLLHCDIGPEGLKYLSASNLSLKSLRLEGNKIGALGARFIGSIISKCKELEDLDIGETDQTNESIQAILIVTEKSSLKSINISRIIPKTYYTQYDTNDLADDIGILMKLNTSMEVLKVEKCGFDGHDIEVLVEGLRYHKNLTMLELGANRFGDHGVIFLASWLNARPSLIGLRIPANNITEKGAIILAKTLPFSRIRYLDLQYNKIGGEGISDLLYSIKKSTPMRVFLIWGNEIGSRDLIIFDKLLKAGVLEQENIDLKIYTVDGVKRAAFYPSNRYVNKSYSISEYGFPPTLKTVKNKIISPKAKPKALLDFDFIDRYPKAEEENDGLLSKVSWDFDQPNNIQKTKVTRESSLDCFEDRLFV